MEPFRQKTGAVLLSHRNGMALGYGPRPRPLRGVLPDRCPPADRGRRLQNGISSTDAPAHGAPSRFAPSTCLDDRAVATASGYSCAYTNSCVRGPATPPPNHPRLVFGVCSSISTAAFRPRGRSRRCATAAASSTLSSTGRRCGGSRRVRQERSSTNTCRRPRNRKRIERAEQI